MQNLPADIRRQLNMDELTQLVESRAQCTETTRRTLDERIKRLRNAVNGPDGDTL